MQPNAYSEVLLFFSFASTEVTSVSSLSVKQSLAPKSLSSGVKSKRIWIFLLAHTHLSGGHICFKAGSNQKGWGHVYTAACACPTSGSRHVQSAVLHLHQSSGTAMTGPGGKLRKTTTSCPQCYVATPRWQQLVPYPSCIFWLMSRNCRRTEHFNHCW